jgi:hypothetical protein
MYKSEAIKVTFTLISELDLIVFQTTSLFSNHRRSSFIKIARDRITEKYLRLFSIIAFIIVVQSFRFDFVIVVDSFSLIFFFFFDFGLFSSTGRNNFSCCFRYVVSNISLML